MVQIFDSWASELSPQDFEIFSAPYIKQIINDVRKVTRLSSACYVALNHGRRLVFPDDELQIKPEPQQTHLCLNVKQGNGKGWCPWAAYSLCSLIYQLSNGLFLQTHPQLKIILYISGSGGLLERMAACNPDIMSIDQHVDMREAIQRIGPKFAVQVRALLL